MDLLGKDELLNKGRKVSFMYLLLRILVIGIGFYRKNIIGKQMVIIRSMCLSICVTNVYMFIYLENAMSRKNLEQCKAYWVIILIASLEASVIVESVFKFTNHNLGVVAFSLLYLGLCVGEFIRMYFVCKEYGDMFEWYYFKQGGVSSKLKGK
ncbi:uncharacterized protein Eint_080920 [Encephalitozoon intestinalis ATCC 50506]|uniref:Uncharacterized protein n=1 Tax=Encephalitozoon intestinalis (strain ATCC 50506) TaxID=876142 RepID=E0S8P1_ENCIT|nr:uncharacterized protein Eint_080920 [Encephalitozoon intestinalis ATCC 50506]ADM12024.1 hypothetical protein Eint_080920 [Encephalitozoon intestinalis ATCC 50506]UTX45813.1 hypothetical protein GPK93_08g13920 [Encephalitozoon intestinalis]